MLTKNSIIEVNGFEFEKFIQKGVALVDFWAEWCAPCRMQTPILEEIGMEMGQLINVATINVDDNRQIAARYGIMSIPTLIIFKNGTPVHYFVGLQDKNSLMYTLKNFINESK